MHLATVSASDKKNNHRSSVKQEGSSFEEPSFLPFKANEMQNPETADYVFLGAGASTTLLLMRMERHGLLANKKIAIFDPAEKTQNDKTYCFWSSELVEPALSCAHLISHRWEKINVNRSGCQYSATNGNYQHISSIDLYSELRRIADAYVIKRLFCPVNHIQAAGKGLLISSSMGDWSAAHVFDSRTPTYMSPARDDAHIYQSFVGYVISVKSELAADQPADLMDFEVEQDDATQFMYVLPFGKNRMLVELTRFGEAKIDEERAKMLLDKYISERFGDYDIEDIERGCIPMSTVKTEVEPMRGVVPIGARAGALKPSTGYAFKNMFFHADSICKSIQNAEEPEKINRAARFRLYDRLLLLILLKQPHLGKVIFQRLFSKNALGSIFNFLDEKTSVAEEIRIFSTLPIVPFLRALAMVLLSRMRLYTHPLCVLLLCALLVVAQYFIPQLYGKIQWILFGVGLLVVGIPHGAIDHLLETNNLCGKISFVFVLKYLGLAVLYFLCWLVAPLPALLFFVVFSAWHFGQADALDWQVERFRSLVNFGWGFLVLAIICLGHPSETNFILQGMNISHLELTEPAAESTLILLSVMSALWAILRHNFSMLLSLATLLLASRLPLVAAFGLYFIGQHSVTVWFQLRRSMSAGNLALYVKALPFTAGAVLLFCILAYFYKGGHLQDFESRWLAVFFVFISCISFPHVMAMSNYYGKSYRRE